MFRKQDVHGSLAEITLRRQSGRGTGQHDREEAITTGEADRSRCSRVPLESM